MTRPDLPYLQVIVPFEGTPILRLWAPNYEAQVRYLDWLATRPELARIYWGASAMPVATSVAA